MKNENHNLTACFLTCIMISIIWFLIDKFPEKNLYDAAILHCLVFLNMSEILKK